MNSFYTNVQSIEGSKRKKTTNDECWCAQCLSVLSFTWLDSWSAVKFSATSCVWWRWKQQKQSNNNSVVCIYVFVYICDVSFALATSENHSWEIREAKEKSHRNCETLDINENALLLAHIRLTTKVPVNPDSHCSSLCLSVSLT